MSETITGRFTATSDSPYWIFGVQKIKVCILSLPFVSRLLDYTLVGKFYEDGVFYPEYVSMDVMKEGAALSHVVYGSTRYTSSLFERQ